MLLADELLRALQRAATAVYMSMMYYVLCVRYANIWAYMSCLCAHRARVCHAIIGIIARAPLSFEGESARIVFSVCVKRELSVHFALFKHEAG